MYIIFIYYVMLIYISILNGEFNMTTQEKLEFVKSGLKNLQISLTEETQNVTLCDINEFVKLYLDIIEK